MCDKTVCERARTDKGVGVIEVYKRHEFDSSPTTTSRKCFVLENVILPGGAVSHMHKYFVNSSVKYVIT